MNGKKKSLLNKIKFEKKTQDKVIDEFKQLGIEFIKLKNAKNPSKLKYEL